MDVSARGVTRTRIHGRGRVGMVLLTSLILAACGAGAAGPIASATASTAGAPATAAPTAASAGATVVPPTAPPTSAPAATVAQPTTQPATPPAATAASPTESAAAPAAGAAMVNIVEPPFKQPQEWHYDPAALTVKVGETITWTNTGAVLHTVTADDGSAFDSGNLNPKATFTFTPRQAGTIAYHCTLHPWMKGTITVQS
jgi:plastocyanin